MAFSLNDITQAKPKSPTILVYGRPGVGKTSFAFAAPAAVFIQAEDGAGMLPLNTFGMLTSYQQIVEAGEAVIRGGDSGIKTVVYDTIDVIEDLVIAHTCAENRWKNIEAPGYGKGYAVMMSYWDVIFNQVRTMKHMGITVIFLAHAVDVMVQSPDVEPYSQSTVKLHKNARALFIEHCDCILYATEKMVTRSDDMGLKKHVRGVGAGERVLRATPRPAHVAKNRFDMPDELPLSWDAVAQYLPGHGIPL